MTDEFEGRPRGAGTTVDDTESAAGRREIGRRKFLGIAAGGTLSGMWLVSCSSGDPVLWRYLTPEEATLIDAVADQIIPPDDLPGGGDAGVSTFIDRQLVTYYRDLQQRYRFGLRALQETSRQLHNQDFERLSFTTQTELLTALEKGEVPAEDWSDESPAAFFQVLRDHCMQGYYGTPRHGGNRDFVGYRVVGMDYPQIVGRVKA